MATTKTRKKTSPAHKVAGRKTAIPARKVAAKGGERAPAAAVKYAKRADFGSPIDGFFDKQPATLQPILIELRKLVEAAAPDADSTIKWGMPFYSVHGNMMCALGGHKSHVNLILAGPPRTFVDPKGLLEGDGKTGRRLKLTKLDDLPRDAVRTWLKAAAKLARSKA